MTTQEAWVRFAAAAACGAAGDVNENNDENDFAKRARECADIADELVKEMQARMADFLEYDGNLGE